MTSMLSELASLTAAIATATAPAGAHNLHYITQQVEHFYGDGWHTLLWEVGLITATLGVLAPVLINWNKTRVFKQRIVKAETRLRTIEDSFRRETEEIKRDIQRTATIAKADVLTSHASNLPPLKALTKLLVAAEFYIKGGGYEDANNRLNEISADEFISALQANHKSEMRRAINRLKEQADRVKKVAEKIPLNEYMRDTLLNNIQRVKVKYDNTFGASMDHKQNEESK